MNGQKLIGALLITAGIAVAACAAVIYYPKFADYKKARDLYDDIRDTYTYEDSDDFGGYKGLDVPASSETEAVEDSSSESVFEFKNLVEEETESMSESTGVNSTDAFLKISPILLGLNKNVNMSDYKCINIDAVGLKKKNKDFIGWIYIPKTNISYPVVLSKDNQDYLHKNFAGDYNYPGTIFMDCRCKKGVLNHHSVIYGHNMRDGSMFANIKNYTTEKFFKEHPVFWFITPKYKLLYRVFSAYETNPYDKVAYAFDNEQYSSNEKFIDVIDEMQEKSSVSTKKDIKLEDTDYIMSLSTCTSARTTRIIVHGVLLGNYSS